MTRVRYVVVLAIPVLIGAAVATNSPMDVPAIGETARIRTHLATVERKLQAKDVSSLSVAQRVARARNLDVLHEYWMRGIFPSNTDFPGERVPYFIDRYGTRCAMAYLIEQSGHGDLVARVAATHNNARVRELQDDPALVAKRILDGVKPGSIILLHDGLDGTVTADRTVLVKALPLILDGLKAKGLTPVRLDELLGKPGYLDHC